MGEERLAERPLIAVLLELEVHLGRPRGVAKDRGGGLGKLREAMGMSNVQRNAHGRLARLVRAEEHAEAAGDAATQSTGSAGAEPP